MKYVSYKISQSKSKIKKKEMKRKISNSLKANQEIISPFLVISPFHYPLNLPENRKPAFCNGLRGYWLGNITTKSLYEKCSNTEFFLVRISPYSVRMRRSNFESYLKFGGAVLQARYEMPLYQVHNQKILLIKRFIEITFKIAYVKKFLD